MKIAIANDHRGVDRKNEIKEFLEDKGYIVIDCGTNTSESVDYPEYAFKVALNVSNKNADMGILLCGTGIGMSIAANKVKGIRCAKVDNVNDTYYTRLHNDANVMAMSAEKDLEETLRIIETFVSTKFSNEERHIRRIEMIDNYGN